MEVELTYNGSHLYYVFLISLQCFECIRCRLNRQRISINKRIAFLIVFRLSLFKLVKIVSRKNLLKKNLVGIVWRKE